ncbi:MAG: glucose-6-phosphate dehydrogenase assembly protein OpcA [Chloroflexota bacterium]|nr:glucose-6-phosphate dehydrogenase assembly protein OpcA [Chloroflexota bacterium]
MADNEKTPTPADAAAPIAPVGQAMPIPGDTLPTRSGADHNTHQGLPPLPDPQAGGTMPPTPSTVQKPGPQAALLDEQPGLTRALENSNLDAVAQADADTPADPYSAEALRDIVHGGTISVPVDNIDRELIQAWKSTTSGGDNEGKVAVTLMRAMNLVVYTEDEARTTAANEAIDHIVRRHPCRTIMIANRSGESAAPSTTATPAAGDLEAHLSAHCHTADAGGKQICCEQITVSAYSAAALGRVSNLALNLLITDLPVFLWCASGTMFNNVVLKHLEDSIDRLILDSATFTDPLVGLLGMARSVDPAFRDPDAGRYAPGDLNWGRLTGLREATAGLFDDPTLLPSLGRIGSIEIQYAAPIEDQAANPIQAFLYAAWLASRLQWEFHSGSAGRGGVGDLVLTVRQSVRSIPIVLRATTGSAACPGEVRTVRLTTNDASPLTMTLDLTSDAMYLDCLVEGDGQEQVTRKVRYTAADEVALLDTELEQFGHDEIYEQTLIMAGLMAWGSLSAGRRTAVSAHLGTENRQSSFDPRF